LHFMKLPKGVDPSARLVKWRVRKEGPLLELTKDKDAIASRDAPSCLAVGATGAGAVGTVEGEVVVSA
jgi:hypothetical protein